MSNSMSHSDVNMSNRSLAVPSPRTDEINLALPMVIKPRRTTKRKKKATKKKSKTKYLQTQQRELAMIDSLLNNNQLDVHSMNATLGSPSSRLRSEVTGDTLTVIDYDSSNDSDQELMSDNTEMNISKMSDISTPPDKTPNNTVTSDNDHNDRCDVITLSTKTDQNNSSRNGDHIHTTTIDVNWNLDPIKGGNENQNDETHSIRSLTNAISSIDIDQITSIDIIKEDDYID